MPGGRLAASRRYLSPARPGEDAAVHGGGREKGPREGASREAAIDTVRDFFYRGDIARKIGQFVKENGGLLRYGDLAAYRAAVEEPLKTSYRGFEVYKAGF